MSDHTALCTYRIRQGKEEEFRSHLIKHWPTLRGLGLVTDESSLMFRGTDESGKRFFVEILHWKTAEGPSMAEQMPEVLAIWERMGSLVEGRLGRPGMEFPLVEPVERT